MTPEPVAVETGPETLTVGDLEFAVRRSARRKTLGITVDRGGELLVSAPFGCPDEDLLDFIREKRFWVYTKLAEKDLLDQPDRPKEFVSGEGFSYLGRSYRLLLVDEQDVPLKLQDGRFRLRRSDAASGREHFIRWYRLHAQPWLERRASILARRVGVDFAALRVRDLGYRWGSCRQAVLNFHWAVILLPAQIVEYVIVHELVHIREKNHTPEFWRLVELAMPDYEERKRWLARRGGSYLALAHWSEPSL